MLEPAVRPGQASPSSKSPKGAGPSPGAFENKSFEQLLDELGPAASAETARSPDVDESQDASSRPPPDPLAPLHTVENASLSRLLADRPGAATDFEMDHNRAA